MRSVNVLHALAIVCTVMPGPVARAGEELPEVHLSVHGGAHRVVRRPLEPKESLGIGGVGLALLLPLEPLVFGAGGDALTMLVESDLLLFGTAGVRHLVSSSTAMTALAVAGGHRAAECNVVGNGFGCDSGPPLPFAGARIGLERARDEGRPYGVWLTVARDLKERTARGSSATTFGGTIVLLSLSMRLRGSWRGDDLPDEARMTEPRPDVPSIVIPSALLPPQSSVVPPPDAAPQQPPAGEPPH